jgi:hypothetical protein
LFEKQKKIFLNFFRNVQSILNERLIIDGHKIHALVDNIAKVCFFLIKKNFDF